MRSGGISPADFVASCALMSASCVLSLVSSRWARSVGSASAVCWIDSVVSWIDCCSVVSSALSARCLTLIGSKTSATQSRTMPIKLAPATSARSRIDSASKRARVLARATGNFMRRSRSRQLLDRQRLATGTEADVRALLGPLDDELVETRAAQHCLGRQASQVGGDDVRVDAAAADAHRAAGARHRQAVDPQSVDVPARQSFHARRETAGLAGRTGLQDLQRLRALVQSRRERFNSRFAIRAPRLL